MLKIILVYFNEEKNLDKLFSSLNYLDGRIDYDFICIDQSSTDKSLSIAQHYWKKVILTENKWYADPDKMMAVNTLTKEWDWIFIIDADYCFSSEFLDELVFRITSNEAEAYWIPRQEIFLWINSIKTRQLILFKKWAVCITDQIHNYFHLKTELAWVFSHAIIADDYKEKWATIATWISKIQRYSEIESNEVSLRSYFKILFGIFVLPVIYFFWYGIVHKQFIRGVPGFMNCLISAFSVSMIHMKAYEKKYKNN